MGGKLPVNDIEKFFLSFTIWSAVKLIFLKSNYTICTNKKVKRAANKYATLLTLSC